MKKHANNSSHKWLWPTIISASVIIISIITAIIVWSISKNGDESPVKNDHVVMIVTSRGGLCPNGPCNHPRYSLYENGQFEDHQRLSSADITKIKEIVSDPSFSAMTIPAQDRWCESYMDGQDTVLIFPNIHGDKQFVTCEMTTGKDGNDLDYILSLIRPLDYTLE